jgi:hypothetical protein
MVHANIMVESIWFLIRIGCTQAPESVIRSKYMPLKLTMLRTQSPVLKLLLAQHSISAWTWAFKLFQSKRASLVLNFHPGPVVQVGKVMASTNDSSLPAYDQVIVDIANYVFDYKIESDKAWSSARVAVLDAVGCAIESVAKSSDVRKFIGPIVPGSTIPDGFRLPGTSYQLDPVKGAFDLGTMIRYLDHNDALAGADWGHPSGETHPGREALHNILTVVQNR